MVAAIGTPLCAGARVCVWTHGCVFGCTGVYVWVHGYVFGYAGVCLGTRVCVWVGSGSSRARPDALPRRVGTVMAINEVSPELGSTSMSQAHTAKGEFELLISDFVHVIRFRAPLRARHMLPTYTN